MNSFFASCEQQDRPELRGKPIGVVPMVADTTCCIAASYEAKLFGVRTGTGAREARGLCPNISLVAARPGLYREMHDKIVDAVQLVIPVHDVLSVDEMVIKPWTNEADLPDALRIAQSIHDVIRYEVGDWMTCSVGIGPSPFLAKIASDFQKPRGISVIDMDDIPHKLYGMKLTDWTGIAAGMEARFHKAGVRTTEQMYALSVREMRSVFGSVNGERWYHMIRGQNVYTPPINKWQIGHSNVLSPEFRTAQGAWSIASRLLEKACERLRHESYHAQRLTVSASSFTTPGWTRSIRCQASNKTWQFIDMMKQIWSNQLDRPSHVSVSLQNVIPSSDVTLDMFADPDMNRIDSTIDTINRRFGRGTLTAASSLCSKTYLNHQRIPFGRPSNLR